MSRIYKSEYEDNEIEVFFCGTDEEALKEAYEYESVHGTLFNLFEVNEDYDIIRTIV